MRVTARRPAALLLAVLLAIGGFACRSRERESTDVRPAAPLVLAGGERKRGDAPAARDAEEVALAAQDAEAAAEIALGRALFFDGALSEPTGTSCASCHDPAHAFSSGNASSRGVPRGSRPGHFARRNAPSLLYLKYVPKFHLALEDDDAPAPVPLGGFFWDGRVDTIAELVRQPLLNPDEMNNRSLGSLRDKLLARPYAPALLDRLGASRDPARTATVVGQAIEAYLTSSPMAPFSSKYDDFVRGRAKLSTLELLGLKLFKDPSKGGCAACHRLNDTATDPAMSMFTDYGYDGIGVPRNPELPPSRKADLGLCERADRVTRSDAAEHCAHFRTPTLRNVALRSSYMHSGAFKSLRDVVEFYATRATDPLRWYKSGTRFEDVPAAYRPYVNVQSIPYNRREGDVPALDEREIDAIVAFLRTLSDTRIPSVPGG